MTTVQLNCPICAYTYTELNADESHSALERLDGTIGSLRHIKNTLFVGDEVPIVVVVGILIIVVTKSRESIRTTDSLRALLRSSGSEAAEELAAEEEQEILCPNCDSKYDPLYIEPRTDDPAT